LFEIGLRVWDCLATQLHAVRYGISYRDGAIVAAAECLGARTLFTEDLNHGQRYGSVQAVDPFRVEGSDGVHEASPRKYRAK